jgi:hypothetical protein
MLRGSSLLPQPTHLCVGFAACSVDPQLKQLSGSLQELPHTRPKLGPHAHAHQTVQVLLLTRPRQLHGQFLRGEGEKAQRQ